MFWTLIKNENSLKVTLENKPQTHKTNLNYTKSQQLYDGVILAVGASKYIIFKSQVNRV